jgi:hypothetical protein
MRKTMQILSLSLALVLAFTSLGSTVAFADSSSFSSYDFYPASQEITLWEYHEYTFTVQSHDITLSAASGDPSVIGAEMQKTDEPGQYVLYLSGYKNGMSTITVTASDGTSMSRDVIVGGGIPYSISADTTNDFSISKGNSYIMKVHYINNYPQTFRSPVVASDNESAIKTQILDYEPDANNDYFFRIDTVGNIGQSATLSIGDISHILNKLCKVTIGANKNLRLDTTAQYTCDVGAGYQFIAYTSSPTVPTVSTNSELVATKYIGKVTGGYLFRITSLLPGNALIRVTSDGESASFPVSVKLQSITSDTPNLVSLGTGKSYVYKIRVTGSKDPTFTPEDPSVFSVTSVQKSGGYFYVKVTAKGSKNAISGLIANFPEARKKTYPVFVGYVKISDPSAPAPKSDTTTPVKIAKGTSYTFKITNATLLLLSPQNFKCEFIKTDGYDNYYKVTATGTVGASSDVVLIYGGEAHPVSSVTVGDYPSIKSDTTSDFGLQHGGNYIFKVTTANPQLNFYTGNGALFRTSLIKHIGNDYYFKITANNLPGKSATVFVSIPGDIHPVVTRLCSVTIK